MRVNFYVVPYTSMSVEMWRIELQSESGTTLWVYSA